VSDRSYDELHEFAAAQGIPRRAFEGDHYDVPEERYAALVGAGAQPVAGRDLVRILLGSGLRVQKRRLERVVASLPEAAWLPPGSRADVIASRQAQPPASTVVVRLALWRGDELLVVDRLGGGGPDLPSAPVGDREAGAVLDHLHSVVMGGPVRATTALLGYVRNTVPQPDADYPWPVPTAAFAVWTDEVEAGTRALAGRWVLPADVEDHLSSRHWWPLVSSGPRG
jgi:hypothetical protein